VAGVSALVAIVLNQLRQLRRDRAAAMFLVVMPVCLMVVLGNIYAAEDHPVPRLAVVDAPGPVADAIATVLESSGAAQLVPVAGRGDLDRLVRRRHVDAGLVLPADGTTSVELVGAPDVQLPGGVRQLVSGAVVRVDAAVALADAVPELDLDAALRSLGPQPALRLGDGSEARREAAAAVLVLVTFMNLIAFGSVVPTHRRLGVLARLGAMPVGAARLTVGYIAAFTAVAGVQIAVALLAGRLFLGVEWGPAGVVGPLVMALAVAAGAVGALAGTLLPGPEAGSTIGGPVGFVLGMLGGCLWPLSIVGRPLQLIGQLTPHAWAVEGLRVASEHDATLGSVAVAGAVLAGTALVCGGVGARRLATAWR
jgi:ABC-2 type transport system permease protein